MKRLEKANVVVPFHTRVFCISEVSQNELTYRFDQNECVIFGLYLLETSRSFFAPHQRESCVFRIFHNVVLHTTGSSNTWLFVSYRKDPAKYDYTGERAADDEVPWCFCFMALYFGVPSV